MTIKKYQRQAEEPKYTLNNQPKEDTGLAKLVYEKPLLEKQDGMIFPTQIFEKFNDGRFCMQCSGCHGCR